MQRGQERGNRCRLGGQAAGQSGDRAKHCFAPGHVNMGWMGWPVQGVVMFGALVRSKPQNAAGDDVEESSELGMFIR